MKVLNYGLDKKFYDRYEPEELLDNLGISGEKIIEELKSDFDLMVKSLPNKNNQNENNNKNEG